MKKLHIIFVIAVLAAAVATVGCRKYDDPADWTIYTDGNFQNIVPISQVKQLYYDAYPSQIGQKVEISQDWTIKGKVISSDRFGNFYRSLYIQDESGAIEIKLGITNSYNDYKVGQWVYVKVRGLVLGNYRYMLSLGSPSADPSYANNFIDLQSEIDAHVFRGERVGLTAADTMVVTNWSQVRDPQDLGRLIRFEGVQSTWTTTENGVFDDDVYPSFQNSSYKNITYYYEYPDGNIVSYDLWKDETAPQEHPGWILKHFNMYAFSDGTKGNRFYGSVLFRLGSQDLIARNSAYARFALNTIPENGQVCDVTAILVKFSSSSGGFIKYQLALNTDRDVKVR